MTKRAVKTQYWMNLHSNMVRFIIWIEFPKDFKKNNLHSNMVRFIIKNGGIKYGKRTIIYIPIWLDLLFHIFHSYFELISDLHSNMVRFIIRQRKTFKISYGRFTFQYG